MARTQCATRARKARERARTRAGEGLQPPNVAVLAAGSTEMAVDVTKVSELDVEPGALPPTMAAWVIREERMGEPKDAFQLEEIEVPEPGAFEVIVRVMAAGVHYNSVWEAHG